MTTADHQPHRLHRTIVALRSTAVTALAAFIAAVVTVGFTNPAAAAQTTGRLDVEAVDEFVDGQLDRHRIPGGTLALIDGGRVTHTAAFGNADADQPMTAEISMPIGSVTKVFTAVAILQLVESGDLELDAPVRDYLPWFTVDHTTASTQITVRHLLQHTSGLSDPGYNRVLPEDTSLEEAVRDLQHARPTAEVGSRHQYFNPNYSVLALLIESTSGSSYGGYLADNIVEPLGMSGTYAADPGGAGDTTAQGHLKLFGYPVAVDPPYDLWRQGADGVISTVPDLARLAIALSGDGTVEGARLLSPDSVAQMWTPHGVDGAPYGLGWEPGEHRGEKAGGHGGADPAFSAELAVLPDRGRGYVLLINSDHLFDLMVARPQIQVGMLDLLQDRPPTDGGLTMKTIGAATLLLTLLITVMAIRSAYKLRGWADRARTMSKAELLRSIAPKFVVPALVWLAIYQLSPLLMDGRAFNVRYVGAYFLPDLVILLVVATLPDVILGVYMLATALRARRTPLSADVTAHDERTTYPAHAAS
jgi:CubicO group peptidase (beta-lactamase class C family)